MDSAKLGSLRRRIRGVLRRYGGKFVLGDEGRRLVEEIGRHEAESGMPLEAYGKLVGLSKSQIQYVHAKFKGQRKLKTASIVHSQPALPKKAAAGPQFSEIRISGPEPIEVRTPGGHVVRFSSVAQAIEFIGLSEAAENGGAC